MLNDDSVLAWVPAIVGRRWEDQDAVLVIGTAYAGFISEFSGRDQRNTIPLTTYQDLAREPVINFQAKFLETVAREDRAFYNPVAKLIEDLPDLAKIAVFDLCRASFVRRGEGHARRSDISKERLTVCVNPEIYSEYVEWIDSEENGPGADFVESLVHFRDDMETVENMQRLGTFLTDDFQVGFPHV